MLVTKISISHKICVVTKININKNFLFLTNYVKIYVVTKINITSTRMGRILGAISLRLSTKARVAALGRSFPRWKPTNPLSSSFCMQQLYDSSLAPWWVRTRVLSLNMALSFKDGLLVRIMAQPPVLKRQLASIMERSLPVYQPRLSDSDVTTSARWFRTLLNMLCTMLMEIKLALQPIPVRL